MAGEGGCLWSEGSISSSKIRVAYLWRTRKLMKPEAKVVGAYRSPCDAVFIWKLVLTTLMRKARGANPWRSLSRTTAFDVRLVPKVQTHIDPL